MAAKRILGYFRETGSLNEEYYCGNHALQRILPNGLLDGCPFEVVRYVESENVLMSLPSSYVFNPCPVSGITTSASGPRVSRSRYAASAAGAIADVGST